MIRARQAPKGERPAPRTKTSVSRAVAVPQRYSRKQAFGRRAGWPRKRAISAAKRAARQASASRSARPRPRRIRGAP